MFNFFRKKIDKREEVFILYAGEEKSKKIVEKLKKLFKNIEPFDYKEPVNENEKREFIRNMNKLKKAIGKGKTIIIVLSEKYLAESHYCLEEIREILLKDSDKKSLIERVFLIVNDNALIDKLFDEGEKNTIKDKARGTINRETAKNISKKRKNELIYCENTIDDFLDLIHAERYNWLHRVEQLEELYRKALERIKKLEKENSVKEEKDFIIKIIVTFILAIIFIGILTNLNSIYNYIGNLYKKGKYVDKNYTNAHYFYKLASNKGYLPAKINLGKLYKYGFGVKKDPLRAIGYFKEACDKGNMDGCYLEGGMLILKCRNKVYTDYKKAFELFKTACKNGYQRACAALGYMYENGKGVDKNISKAVELYKSSCKKGSMLGCSNLGYMCKGGFGVPKNIQKAIDYFNKACNSGEVYGCIGLAFIYQDENKDDFNSKLKALEIFKDSCEKNYAKACTAYGYMYDVGLGVEENATLAFKYYKKGCDSCNMWGCNNLGWLYEKGKGVIKDIEKAIKLYKQACDDGYAYACRNLGRIYKNGKTVKQNYQKAMKYFTDAYKKGNIESYVQLGDMYYYGLGVDNNYTKAIELFKKACKNNNMWGCNYLGWMYKSAKGVDKNTTKALQLYKKACKSKYYYACINLGFMYRDGKGVKQNYKKALELFKKSAKHNEPKAYTALGDMYNKELGVKKNYHKAIKLFEKACSHNNMWGCNYLGWMYDNAKGVDKNITKALQLYEKACNGKEYVACKNIIYTVVEDENKIDYNNKFLKALQAFKILSKKKDFLADDEYKSILYNMDLIYTKNNQVFHKDREKILQKLLKYYKQHKEDIDIIYVYSELSEYYRKFYNYDLSKKYLDYEDKFIKEYNLSKDKKEIVIAKLIFDKLLFYYDMGNKKETSKYIQESLKYYNQYTESAKNIIKNIKNNKVIKKSDILNADSFSSKYKLAQNKYEAAQNSLKYKNKDKAKLYYRQSYDILNKLHKKNPIPTIERDAILALKGLSYVTYDVKKRYNLSLKIEKFIDRLNPINVDYYANTIQLLVLQIDLLDDINYKKEKHEKILKMIKLSKKIKNKIYGYFVYKYLSYINYLNREEAISILNKVKEYISKIKKKDFQNYYNAQYFYNIAIFNFKDMDYKQAIQNIDNAFAYIKKIKVEDEKEKNIIKFTLLKLKIYIVTYQDEKFYNLYNELMNNIVKYNYNKINCTDSIEVIAQELTSEFLKFNRKQAAANFYKKYINTLKSNNVYCKNYSDYNNKNSFLSAQYVYLAKLYKKEFDYKYNDIINAYKMSIKYDKRQDLVSDIADKYIEIGNIYLKYPNFKKAVENFNKAKIYLEKESTEEKDDNCLIEKNKKQIEELVKCIANKSKCHKIKKLDYYLDDKDNCIIDTIENIMKQYNSTEYNTRSIDNYETNYCQEEVNVGI